MPPSKAKELRAEIKQKMAKYKADKPCIKPPKAKSK
jgi:hypothetical protein